MSLTAALKHLSASFVQPLVTAGGVLRDRRSIVLRLEDEQGCWGLGEAAPLPGFSKESLGRVSLELMTWSWPERFVHPREVQSWPRSPSARHAAQLALLDGWARQRGRTVAQILSPHPQSSVEVNALVDTEKQAVRAVQEGFSCLKIKLGWQPFEHEMAQLLRLRTAVGPEVVLRVDVNGAWTLQQAQRSLEVLQRARVHCLEQPLPATALSELASLRPMAAERGIALALDESVRSPEQLERVLLAGAADAIVIKPMMVGGPLVAFEMMSRVLQEGLGGFVTSSLDGPIGRTGALHVAAACPLQRPPLTTSGLWPCGLNTGALFEREWATAFVVEAGRAMLPLGEGLGVELLEAM